MTWPFGAHRSCERNDPRVCGLHLFSRYLQPVSDSPWRCAVTAAVHADGDGAPDVVRTFLRDGSWHLVAELSSGGVTEHVVVPANELEPARRPVTRATRDA